MQEPDLFGYDLAAHVDETSDVAARPVEACHQSKLNRVAGGAEDDRNRGRQRFGSKRAHGASRRGNDIDPSANEISRQLGHAIALILPPAEFYRQIASLEK